MHPGGNVEWGIRAHCDGLPAPRAPARARLDHARRRLSPGRAHLAAGGRRQRAGPRGARVHPVPQERRHGPARRAHPPLLRRPRLRLGARRHARLGRLGRGHGGRVPAAGAARWRRGRRLAGGPAVVHGPRRHHRQVVGRLQRSPDRRARPAGARGRDQRVLDRRPLLRRRPLHGRLPAFVGQPLLGDDDARDQRPAARSGRGRRALARRLARAHGRDSALQRGLDVASAARRVLEAGFGVRGLRGDHVPRVHGRRLGRRLPRRDLPPARGLPRGEPRADRAVGPSLPAVGRARAGDRLPAGVRALVGPLAQGRRQRHRARAESARLAAGARRACAVVSAARGTLGRRVVMARSRDRAAPARARVPGPWAERRARRCS